MNDAPDLSRTRYGTGNPERVTNPTWDLSVKHDWHGARLRQHLGIELLDSHFGHNFSHSTFRETTPGPFWSWQRFGRTSTTLPDGRIIHVAGEHEDSYDVNFCIYNDVVVEHPDGSREFFLYPADVFPPTDFHSATLIGNEIVLIGNLGYRDQRRPGETQVLKLNCETLRMECLVTHGDGPGWISRHTAELTSETTIKVSGGKVQTPTAYENNTGVFELNLATLTWRRHQP